MNTRGSARYLGEEDLARKNKGMGAIFVPLSTMAYGTLAPEQADAGAGLFDLARTLGSAMRVSIAISWYTRFSQADWNHLGGHIDPFAATKKIPRFVVLPGEGVL